MNTVSWCSRRKRNGTETFSMALHLSPAKSILEKSKHLQWCLAGFIPTEISQVCYPVTVKENTINPRDQDRVIDFPPSFSDIHQNEPITCTLTDNYDNHYKKLL